MKQTSAANVLDPTQKLLVIIGPSGSGKSKLVRVLVEKGLIELTPSWTTRPRRIHDEEALDHVFVNEAEFRRLEIDNFFLETAQLFNMPYMYGLPKVRHDNPGAVPTVLLRAMVAPLVQRHYTSVVIYQVEAPKQITEQRIIARGGNSVDISNRINLYEKELQAGRQLADRVFVNDADFQKLVTDVTLALQQDFPKF